MRNMPKTEMYMTFQYMQKNANIKLNINKISNINVAACQESKVFLHKRFVHRKYSHKVINYIH